MSIYDLECVGSLKVWTTVEVDYSDEWQCWMVGAYDPEGNREHLVEATFKKHAIDDAMLYAFDTSCGPTRAHSVRVFTKSGKLQRIIEG